MALQHHSSEKEKVAQLVLDNVLDGIITINRLGIIESFNPAAKNIFGYTADEVIGKNIKMLMPEPYKNNHDSYLRNYLESGIAKIIGIGREVIGKRKDGSTFPMDLAVSKFYIGDNIHYVGIVHDISERKATEAALEKALKDDLKHTVKNIQGLVFKYQRNDDEEFVYTLSEGILAQDLNMTTEIIRNQRPCDIYHQELASFLTTNYEQAFAGNYVNYVMNLEGKAIYVSLSPIVENGVVKEVVGSGIDMTERMKMEDELAFTRDKALEASKLKSQFLANMSHEIRTPMNGIIGMTDLLHDTKLDTEQKEFVNTVHESAQSLLTIINDILDFSKMEADKLEIDQVVFQIKPLIEGIAEILLSKARSKGISLLTFIDPAIPPQLVGDPVRLRQILLNLADNAIKFTDQGSVMIHAELVTTSKNHPTVYFSVIDTGIGLTDQEIGRLFQPFSQADGSTTRKYGGTGLGLAISKRLVELMDGEIGVDSEKNNGAVFWFNLSFKNAEQTISDKAVHVIESENQATTCANPNTHLLLVEDNPVNQKVANYQLKKLGYSVDAVTNGREAVEKLTTHTYPIIFMDIQMPEMDGIEATKIIRGMRGTKGDTPIIAMTANAMQSDKERYLNAGMSDYLSKPVTLGQLEEVLNKYINKKEEDIPPIDAQKLKNTYGKDEDILKDFLLTFTTSTPALLNQLQGYLDKKDRKSVSEIAHGLKGSAVVVEATKMADLSRAMEQAIKQDDWGEAGDISEKLFHAFREVVVFVEANFK